MTPTIAWLVNLTATFAVTFGALFLFLNLHRSKSLFQHCSPEINALFLKHRRGLLIGVGLLSAWLVVQAVALIYP